MAEALLSVVRAGGVVVLLALLMSCSGGGAIADDPVSVPPEHAGRSASQPQQLKIEVPPPPFSD